MVRQLPRPAVGRLTEPTPAERARFADWLARHALALDVALITAERLQIAYDHAAIVTAADHDPRVPAEIQEEIDECYSYWEVARWAGQKRPNATS